MTNSKRGKKNCEHSKGIPEEIIELAFLESYAMISGKDRDLVEGFVKRVETTLGLENISKDMKKLQHRSDEILAKKKKLLDLVLEDKLDKEDEREFEEVLEYVANNIPAFYHWGGGGYIKPVGDLEARAKPIVINESKRLKIDRKKKLATINLGYIIENFDSMSKDEILKVLKSLKEKNGSK
jgi:hypothetical protein